MMKKLFISSVLMTIGVVYLAQTAWANDRDLRGTTVPASICEPANSAQANRVRLVNGSWVFRGNNTGTVTFFCALPRNGRTLSDNTDDNDITKYQVYYRDTDGTGTAARVTVRLCHRRPSGQFCRPTWTSGGGSFDHTDVCVDESHDMRADGIYAFRVTLSRTNTTQNPAFSGIMFPTGLGICPMVTS